MAADPVAALIAARQAATPGPLVVEQAVTADHFLHWEVRTQDPQPDAPWSPRYVAWLTGMIREADATGMYLCPECHHIRAKRRHLEVPIDVRADDQTQADARYIAAAYDPALIPALVAQQARIAVLEAALALVAALEPDLPPDVPDDYLIDGDISVGYVRRARALLGKG